MGGVLKGGAIAELMDSTGGVGGPPPVPLILEGIAGAPAAKADIAPDPHPEGAAAWGLGDRGECSRVSLLCRRVPGVLARQGRRVSRARRVPFVGGERPAHDRHGPRALAGRPGRTGDGDGPAKGIGAGRVVEFDPAADARRVGAMGPGSHAEGRRRARRTGQDLDLQVADQTGPGPALDGGGGADQGGGQVGDVAGGGPQHPGIADRTLLYLRHRRQGEGRTQQDGGASLKKEWGGGGNKRLMIESSNCGVAISLQILPG